MTTRPIRFIHRGRTVGLDDIASTRSVLDWLREDAHCTGTKEGCAEGDCGACTVVVGELDEAGAVQLRPVNACIQFVPTLDGKVLFTVEDLARATRSSPSPAATRSSPSVPVPGEGAGAPALHPVQQAMVDCHGSQCGFCTPGFVMSLWACWQLHTTAGTVPTRQQLADDLSGNLCRCTGYRPILDAGQRMFEAPTVAGDTLDRAPGSALALALAALRDERPLATAGGFHAPRTVEALALLLQQQPQARILAGATDIGLWVTKRFRDLPLLVSVGEVAQLKRIAIDGDTLRIGGAASLEAAWTALVDRWPGLRDLWLRFASPPVRSVGTMGGNVANGSPIGDSAPVLMALDARLVLRLGQRQRLVAIAAFYIDYMKNRLEPGEFVEAIEVPLDPGHSRQVRAYKVSKRFDSDISAVSAGLSIALQDGKIADVRIAFGGMAAIVRRAASAEEALRGQAWDEGSLQAAQEALANDFQPLSDMRAGSAYRLQVAQNLLRRFWLETRAAGALSECGVNVWSREVV